MQFEKLRLFLNRKLLKSKVCHFLAILLSLSCLAGSPVGQPKDPFQAGALTLKDIQLYPYSSSSCPLQHKLAHVARDSYLYPR